MWVLVVMCWIGISLVSVIGDGLLWVGLDVLFWMFCVVVFGVILRLIVSVFVLGVLFCCGCVLVGVKFGSGWLDSRWVGLVCMVVDMIGISFVVSVLWMVGSSYSVSVIVIVK